MRMPVIDFVSLAVNSVEDVNPTEPLHYRIGNALAWVCSAEESMWPPLGSAEDISYRAYRDSGPGRVVTGLRRARNSLLHTLVAPARDGGLEYPLGGTSGALDYPPVWAPLRSLPAARTKRADQDAAYGELVAGRKVVDPLREAEEWLRVELAT